MTSGDGLQVVQGGPAAALLKPMRRRVLEALAEPASAAQVGRKLGLARQKINYHLRDLERRGLVELVEERRNGNCTERLLRAKARSFVIHPDALGALAGSPADIQDRFSAAYLVALGAKLVKDVGTLRARADAARKRVPTLAVETEVTFRSAEDRANFTRDLTDAVARLVAQHGAEKGRSYRFVLAGHPALSEEP